MENPKHTASTVTTRGLRNNNPLNIRTSPQRFLGETDICTDRAFKQFQTLEYGLRAAFVILRTYQRKHRLTTPAAMISRWAPRTENDTRRYISIVCRRSALAPDQQLPWTDQHRMCALVSAMAFVESAADIAPDTLRRAYWMAYSDV